MNRKVGPALRTAANMPPRIHWPRHRCDFDIMRSEAVQWLIAQPEIRQWIFNMVKHAGAITFDIESRTWRGVEWQQSNVPLSGRR